MFSRVFKDIVKKTAFFKEFPGLENNFQNNFQNSGGFKEIKDPYEPWYSSTCLQRTLWSTDTRCVGTV